MLVVFAGYHTTGYVAPSTMVWRTGRSEWQPLQEIPELAVAIKQGLASDAHLAAVASAVGSVADISAREAGNAVQSSADASQAAYVPPKPASAKASKAVMTAPVVAAAAQQQDPMSAFLGEISAIEAVRTPCAILIITCLQPCLLIRSITASLYCTKSI